LDFRVHADRAGAEIFAEEFGARIGARLANVTTGMGQGAGAATAMSDSTVKLPASCPWRHFSAAHPLLSD
jgi:hypothetical protein